MQLPQMGFGQVRKGLTSLPDRLMMGAATMPKLPTKECKSKGHIVIPYTQGLCESIKRICGRYGIQTHFKGALPSKTYWSPPRTKTLWSTKAVPYTGTNVVT